MSKYKRKGRSKFIMLEKWFYQSEAWAAALPSEKAAYLIFKDIYIGTNNGDLDITIRQMADAINVGKNVANKAINGLIEKGFLEVTKRSSFHVKNRTATLYRLTEYACDVSGNPATKAFMKWRCEEKQQSRIEDQQSRERDKCCKSDTVKPANSPVRGTVGTNYDFSQYREQDTYIDIPQGVMVNEQR
ncbi:hypothetical protein [Ahrensia sp. 13_GOM-1096m]|uniref:hypothetical protein n=1 Tax=Ahrensia sp. 13_GOM-1096m TaxID=1380380 RepID=UPI0006854441|nr:hypothetical protein [Ahrensia sp. 13_GOM-1096m]